MCCCAFMLSCKANNLPFDDSAQRIMSAFENGFVDSLSMTSLFTDGDPERPSSSLVEFAVNVPFWSDGARKRRWVFVPTPQRIEFDRKSGGFVYPKGTIFIKHFSSPDNARKPIETRLSMLQDDNTWHFATYIYSESGDATRSDRPAKVSQDGVTYRIPSERECQTCHSVEIPVLGFNIRQLNFVPGDWNGLIKRPARNFIPGRSEDENPDTMSLESPANQRLSIHSRARIYLHVNCSPCHNPAGLPYARELDFRIEAPDTGLLTKGKLIPGNLQDSILWQKIAGDSDRMPPLSLRPDPMAIEIFKKLIEEWPAK